MSGALAGAKAAARWGEHVYSAARTHPTKTLVTTGWVPLASVPLASVRIAITEYKTPGASLMCLGGSAFVGLGAVVEWEIFAGFGDVVGVSIFARFRGGVGPASGARDSGALGFFGDGNLRRSGLMGLLLPFAFGTFSAKVPLR